jgi:hypothetical protein
MTNNKPTIGVPTNWKAMRYCIVAALDKIGGDNEADRKEIYMAPLQFFISRIFDDDDLYSDDYWDDRSAEGKAFYRAMESLREDGIVTHGDWGYRLARWGEAS